jgi:hypothetical protein
VSLLSLLDGTFSLLDVELGLGLLLFRFSQLSIILVLISLSDWTEMFQAESPTTEVRSSVSFSFASSTWRVDSLISLVMWYSLHRRCRLIMSS